MSDGGKSVEATIKLLYFAWVRSRTGTGSETVPLPATVRNVGELLAWLKTRSPGHADALKDTSAIRVAVNQNYVQAEHPVKPGDEIAIFPPVTGGNAR